MLVKVSRDLTFYLQALYIATIRITPSLLLTLVTNNDCIKRRYTNDIDLTTTLSQDPFFLYLLHFLLSHTSLLSPPLLSARSLLAIHVTPGPPFTNLPHLFYYTPPQERSYRSENVVRQAQLARISTSAPATANSNICFTILASAVLFSLVSPS